MPSEMFSVRNNVPAMFAHRQSVFNNGTISQSLERLSTGQRINRSADDIGGLALSEKLRTQARGFQRAALNVQDATSFLQVADAAIHNIHDLLQRMRELVVQAANGTYTDTDRSLLQIEIDSLLSEIDRIHTSTEFNDRRVFEYRAADIIWIVDGTGSMGPEQALVSAEAPNFVSALLSEQIDYRLGVVRYGGPGLPSTVGSLTTDPTTFAANVTAVGVGLGPDEKAMEAFNQTLNLFSYRPQARKIFIMLTDEDADDGPPVNDVPSPDISAATATNMAANNVVAFVVATAGTGAASDTSFSDVAGSGGVPAATGGTRYTSLATGFSGAVAAAVDALIGEPITVHAGANENQTFTGILPHPVDTASLGIVGKISAGSQSGAEASFAYVDSAINQITRIRSSIGAEMNRMDVALNYARVVGLSIQNAETKVRETDFAFEIGEFTKAQVISQSSNSMLAQANLLPQNVLSLLG